MQKVYKLTPRQDGFRMPGEFEEHQGCWMLWPERTDNWRLGAKPVTRKKRAGRKKREQKETEQKNERSCFGPHDQIPPY